MRNYQPKKYDKLPHNIYMQTIYIIKDYPEMLYRYKSFSALKGKELSGMPKGNCKSDSTSKQAIERAVLKEKIDAIEKCIKMVPNEYRQGILDNIIQNKRFPDYAHKNTWSKWRVKYINLVAKKLSLI